MSKYNIHSDFKKYKNTKLPLYPFLLPLINTLITSGVNKIKPAQGVSATKKKITGYQNGTIELTIYEPKEIEKNAPCLIYLHGGGFVLKAAPYQLYRHSYVEFQT